MKVNYLGQGRVSSVKLNPERSNPTMEPQQLKLAQPWKVITLIQTLIQATNEE
jgi:hypothetical protein